MHTRFALCSFVFLAVGASGCATMRSYSHPRALVGAPYYHSYTGVRVPEGSVVAHLPIGIDETAGPGGRKRSMLVPLLDAMNGFLDAAGWSTRLDSAPAPETEAPWAYVGSAPGLAERRGSGGWSDESPSAGMVIQIASPSRRWAERLRALAARQQADFVLVIALGPGEYYLRQRGGLSLRKELQLGTGYTVPVAWLNAVDQPIQVLHLTGLLLSRDGTVLRAGAEGIIAKQPSFALSLLHLQNPLTESDVASILASLHREDLDGQPLVWQVALENLVRQLLGRP